MINRHQSIKHMVIYNIQTNGTCNQLVIELINDTVFVEPSAVAYVSGNVALQADVIGWKNKFKSLFIGKQHFKPSFKGTGKIYLVATLGSFHKFTLKPQEELVITSKAFIACRNSVTIRPEIKASLGNLISGAPLVNTIISGVGNVMILMPGPVVEQELKDDKFVAYAHDVAAYTKQLRVYREFAGKGGLNIAHKMVQVYRGTGRLYFTPIPNKGSKTKK